MNFVLFLYFKKILLIFLVEIGMDCIILEVGNLILNRLLLFYYLFQIKFNSKLFIIILLFISDMIL